MLSYVDFSNCVGIMRLSFRVREDVRDMQSVYSMTADVTMRAHPEWRTPLLTFRRMHTLSADGMPVLSDEAVSSLRGMRADNLRIIRRNFVDLTPGTADYDAMHSCARHWVGDLFRNLAGMDTMRPDYTTALKSRVLSFTDFANCYPAMLQTRRVDQNFTDLQSVYGMAIVTSIGQECISWTRVNTFQRMHALSASGVPVLSKEALYSLREMGKMARKQLLSLFTKLVNNTEMYAQIHQLARYWVDDLVHNLGDILSNYADDISSPSLPSDYHRIAPLHVAETRNPRIRPQRGGGVEDFD